MLTLEVIKRGAPPTFKHTTEVLYLNPSSIVSVSPANHSKSLLKEVNGMPVNSLDISEVEYTVGGRSERVLVVGSCSEIVNKARGKRGLLNG